MLLTGASLFSYFHSAVEMSLGQMYNSRRENMLQWTLGEERELAVVHGVGQSHSLLGVNESDMENSFHRWFVKAWEDCPGICGLQLSQCHNSDGAEKSTEVCERHPALFLFYLPLIAILYRFWCASFLLSTMKVSYVLYNKFSLLSGPNQEITD